MTHDMNPPLIYASLDSTDMGRVSELAVALSDAGCGIKLGLEFFNKFGPQGVHDILSLRVNRFMFLDLKYHDIPNTVSSAIRAVSSLDIYFLNLHASGGAEMMRQAKAACAPKTKLLAVTVLTSLDADGLEAVGQGRDPAAQVERLARLTHACGLDGVVCSAHEIKTLRNALPKDFVLMVPGIRPAGADVGDQKRVMTPKEAMDAGASHLVVGRPITGAKDPEAAVRDIYASLAQ